MQQPRQQQQWPRWQEEDDEEEDEAQRAYGEEIFCVSQQRAYLLCKLTCLIGKNDVGDLIMCAQKRRNASSGRGCGDWNVALNYGLVHFFRLHFFFCDFFQLQPQPQPDTLLLLFIDANAKISGHKRMRTTVDNIKNLYFFSCDIYLLAEWLASYISQRWYYRSITTVTSIQEL